MRTHYTKPLYTTTEIREAFEMLGDMPSPIDNLAYLTAEDMHDGVPVEEIARRNAPFFGWYPEVSFPVVEKAAQSILAGWNGGQTPTFPPSTTEPSTVNEAAPTKVNTATGSVMIPITIFTPNILYIGGIPGRFAHLGPPVQ